MTGHTLLYQMWFLELCLIQHTFELKKNNIIYSVKIRKFNDCVIRQTAKTNLVFFNSFERWKKTPFHFLFMREYAKDLLRYGQNTRPNLIQGRRNVFEHGEDPSFKIVPLAPSKQSTPPVLGISVCLISFLNGKVEKILKGSMDSISSHLPSVKIQIMGGKIV